MGDVGELLKSMTFILYVLRFIEYSRNFFIYW